MKLYIVIIFAVNIETHIQSISYCFVASHVLLAGGLFVF